MQFLAKNDVITQAFTNDLFIRLLNLVSS